MAQARGARVKALLEEVLQLPAAQRSTFLDAACGADAVLADTTTAYSATIITNTTETERDANNWGKAVMVSTCVDSRLPCGQPLSVSCVELLLFS